MKQQLLLILIATLILGFNVNTGKAIAAAPPDQPPYTPINTEELKKLLDDGTAITLVDARTPEEYQEVHIKGAISIPEKQFSEHLSQLPQDKSAKIVFYCNGIKCGKSKKAAQKALDLGYGNILVYTEGMPVWEEKGMPIFAGPDYEKKVETSRIAPRELDALIKNGAINLTVVDVRDPEEFKAAHIPEAVNIPVAAFAAQSGILDKEKQIVVYCNSGGRSYNAYRKLQKLGYPKINQAILADWQAAGLPVEKP